MKVGTSSLIVAAFVGPGTVLTCASAGVTFGYDLAWVLFFSTAAVFILQSFTAATGILARKGLGEAFRETATKPVARIVLFGLVVVGLWIGCAAFEMGNVVGAASGIQTVLGVEIGIRWIVLAISFLAGLLLLLNLPSLTRIFSLLVVLMSILFFATVIMTPVDWKAALRGLVIPSLPDGSLLTVVALMGTTIVTYNLFLHATATKKHWENETSADAWRRELKGMAIFLPIGGLVSFAILLSGAKLSSTGTEVNQVAAFASLLEPVAGPASRYLFGLGMFAAGITSAITAPLAAAAGITEIFGKAAHKDGRHVFRSVWISVLLTGLFFGLTDFSPLRVIIAAQAANGLLLPFIAAFVLVLAYHQKAVALPRWYLALGVLVTIVCAGLGARMFWWAWQQLF